MLDKFEMDKFSDKVHRFKQSRLNRMQLDINAHCSHASPKNLAHCDTPFFNKRVRLKFVNLSIFYVSKLTFQVAMFYRSKPFVWAPALRSDVL